MNLFRLVYPDIGTNVAAQAASHGDEALSRRLVSKSNRPFKRIINKVIIGRGGVFWVLLNMRGVVKISGFESACIEASHKLCSNGCWNMWIFPLSSTGSERFSRDTISEPFLFQRIWGRVRPEVARSVNRQCLRPPTPRKKTHGCFTSSLATDPYIQSGPSARSGSGTNTETSA